MKWVAGDAEIEAVEDCGQIRSILRRAWAWYRSQVHIEKKEYKAGAMEDGQYRLEKSQRQPDCWIVTDKQNMISIIFEQGKFNDTQRITEFEDFTPEQMANLPRILRELADWLAENHYDKIF